MSRKRAYSGTQYKYAGQYKRRRIVQPYRAVQYSQAEWKYIDVDSVEGHAFDTVGRQYLLNGLEPGTGASERIGMKVSIKTIEMRLVADSFIGCPGSVCRVLLIVDQQSNGADPTLLSSYLTTADYTGMRNLANRKRFKCLLDKAFVVNDFDISGQNAVYRHYYIKLKKPLVTEYNIGVAGTIADIVSNSLYLVVLGDRGAGGTNVNLQCQTRLRYTDT